jgi:hypothetical protein
MRRGLAVAGVGVFFTLPPIWVIPFLNWAAYVIYGGWPLLLALPVTTVWPAWARTSPSDCLACWLTRHHTLMHLRR